ncbi:MAG: hypothetical protein ACPGSE_00540 [Synechococcus sp.]
MRFPVQPLQGTLADLQANLASGTAFSLNPGEIALATDTGRLYRVIDTGGGVLGLQSLGDGWSVIQADTGTTTATNAETPLTVAGTGREMATSITGDQLDITYTGFPGVDDWESGTAYLAGDKVIGEVPVDTFTDITYVGGTSENVADNITLPGVQEGDLVILLGASDSADLNAPGAGSTGTWLQGVPLGLDNNNNPDTLFYYQVVPTGTTSMTAGGLQTSGNGPVYVMIAFRGVDPNNLFGTGSANSGTGVPNPPAVTTTISESMVVAIGYLDDDNSAANVGPPAGYTLGETADTGSTNSSATIMTAYKKVADPGVEDPGAFSTTTDAQKGLTLVLNPVVGSELIWRLFRAGQNFTATGTNFPGDQVQGVNWIEISPGGDGSIVVPGGGGGGGDTEDKFKTIQGDTGSTEADQINDTLQVVGGTAISTSVVGDVLTINYIGGGGSNDQFLFNTFAADTGSVTAASTAETLTIAGGTDISTSISGNTLTIEYNGTGGTGGGITQWAKFLGGLSPDVNTSTTYTARAWLNPTPAFSAGTWSATTEAITIPSTGLWQISVNWYLESTVIRSAPGARISINGTLQPETGANTYIRNNNGHNESSINFSAIYSLTQNDLVRVASAQLAAAGTVSLNSAQSSISLVRLA